MTGTWQLVAYLDFCHQCGRKQTTGARQWCIPTGGGSRRVCEKCAPVEDQLTLF